MTLYPPLKEFIISQKFGDNANGSYAADGLKGHTGVDLESFYGDTISFSAPGKIYKAISFTNPDLSFYRAVFTLVEDATGVFEVSYGHCKALLCKVGDTAKIGDPVATEGNTGTVYSNGILVTEALKESGSQAGTHLHFQVREVKKVQVQEIGKHYLSAQEGDNISYKDAMWNFYEIVNFENGFNGCIDPSPMLSTIPAVDYAAGHAALQGAGTIVREIATAPLSAADKFSLLDSIKKVVQAIQNLFK